MRELPATTGSSPPLYGTVTAGKAVLFGLLGILAMFTTLAYVVDTSLGTCFWTVREAMDSSFLVDFTTFTTECAEAMPSTEVREFLHHQLFNHSTPFQGFPSPEIVRFIKPLKLKSWGSTNPVFQMLIEETKPEVILEFGSFLGSSAIHMANVSRQLGLNPLILCVDDFRGWLGNTHKVMKMIKKVNGQSLLLYQFMQNVVATGFDDMILPIPYSVSHAGQFFCEHGVKADLIEVDAGHTFHSAWMDINIAHSLLRPGGVLFGHDWKKYEVRRAAEIFASLHGGMVVVKEGQHWVLRPNGYKVQRHNRTRKTPLNESVV